MSAAVRIPEPVGTDRWWLETDERPYDAEGVSEVMRFTRLDDGATFFRIERWIGGFTERVQVIVWLNGTVRAEVALHGSVRDLAYPQTSADDHDSIEHFIASIVEHAIARGPWPRAVAPGIELMVSRLTAALLEFDEEQRAA